MGRMVARVELDKEEAKEALGKMEQIVFPVKFNVRQALQVEVQAKEAEMAVRAEMGGKVVTVEHWRYIHQLLMIIKIQSL